VIVDGFICTAAALVAIRLRPEVRDACMFAHRSAEAGHDRMLKALGAEPLLDLGLRLGEGTGGLLARPCCARRRPCCRTSPVWTTFWRADLRCRASWPCS
jgi:NaMN:DMB phosphoribosyltransferase